MGKRIRTALLVIAGLALLALAVMPIKTISVKVVIPQPVAEVSE